MPFNKSKERIEYSERFVKEPSALLVQARNNNTPQKTPASVSPQESMFLNSSQYSQKSNFHDKDGSIESVYLNRKHGEEDSGDFINFDNNSIARSEKKAVAAPLKDEGCSESEIVFEDSVKLKNSRSVELLEYGMDKDAKLPPTLKKPKFGFKQCDTNDSSLILKDISMSQQVNEAQPDKFATPELNSPHSNLVLKSLSPEKRTDRTKGVLGSESLKSSKEEEIELIFKDSPRLEDKKIENIYLSK
jgi:hypothetical protein